MKDQIRNAYVAPSLVEEVARKMAVFDGRESWDWAPYRNSAQIILAVVLRRMEEPSRTMSRAGDDVIRDGAWAEAIIDVDGIWTAMLAAFRKENGVER